MRNIQIYNKQNYAKLQKRIKMRLEKLDACSPAIAINVKSGLGLNRVAQTRSVPAIVIDFKEEAEKRNYKILA
ncbi:MAG: hypothetical protein LBU32_31795 [Clostridiales bacterium]|jgi:hypothetical protein|nr:hypothetical protein [Clostridiales bacterium]